MNSIEVSTPMSPSGRTEHVTVLRAAIARIEAAAAGGREPARRGVALGVPELDRLLGGGLATGALHEVVPASPRDEAAASGFALGLAARCLAASGGVLVWIVDDCAAGESGAPYRPGLAAHGLDPDRLIVVRTGGAAPTLWAAEEALRGRGAVVLAELWGGRQYGLAPSRRLVLAARRGGGVGLVLHAGLPGGAAALSSGSQTRFTVGAMPSPREPAAGRRLPVPGATAFAVQIAKLRTATRAFDPAQPFSLLWNAEQRCFHDAHPVAVAAAPADRPPRRSGRGRP